MRRVVAPFRTARSYCGRLDLFAYQLLETWIEKWEWDYWFCQHLPMRKTGRGGH